MIIDRLLPLPSAPASGDELAIERGVNAYKIDYDAFAAAIIAQYTKNNLTTATPGYALDARQGKTLNDAIAATQSGVAIIVNGDTASMAVPVGGYAYIKNNTHGLTEGLYKNTSSSAFPTSGGTANSSVFTAVSGGIGSEVLSLKNTIVEIKTQTLNVTDTQGNWYINGIYTNSSAVLSVMAQGYVLIPYKRPNSTAWFIRDEAGAAVAPSSVRVTYIDL